MKLDTYISSINKLNKLYLKSVDDSTFEYLKDNTYYTSTSRGMTQLYRNIGLYDRGFVHKLYELDKSYALKTIDNHIRDLSNDFIIISTDTIMRIIRKYDYNNYLKLSEKILDNYNDAEVSIIANDQLWMTDNTSDTNKLICYNLITNIVSSYTYDIYRNKFYGIVDYSIPLDDKFMITNYSVHQIYKSADTDVGTDISLSIGKTLRSLSYNDSFIDSIFINSHDNLNKFYSMNKLLESVCNCYLRHKDDINTIKRCVELSNQLLTQ